MDLRAPKLLKYFGMVDEGRSGVTNYVANSQISLKDIIVPSDKVDNLDLLPSGTIPPNPTELLMSDRIRDMFEDLKKEYDYIIVDTAPVGLVTDTLIFAHFADVVMFVVRSNFLEKKMLNIAKMLYTKKRLPNMSVILNSTDKNVVYGSSYGYGSAYGSYYGYGESEKESSFFKKILKKLKSFV